MPNNLAKRRANSAEWYGKNKSRMSAYRDKIKLEMIVAFGGKCVACKETDPIVLTLDHIQDNGAEQRRISKIRGGYPLYQKLRKKGWPTEGLQLLCCNCNYRKEHARRKKLLAGDKNAQ